MFVKFLVNYSLIVGKVNLKCFDKIQVNLNLKSKATQNYSIDDSPMMNTMITSTIPVFDVLANSLHQLI